MRTQSLFVSFGRFCTMEFVTKNVAPRQQRIEPKACLENDSRTAQPRLSSGIREPPTAQSSMRRRFSTLEDWRAP